MSTFEVRFRAIERIEKHPNADALDLAVIGGYNAVVKKDEFKQNDVALYVPTDSLFKNLEIAKALKIDSYLTGKGKNRVKAIRLRGTLSEGIVIPMERVMMVLLAFGIAQDHIDMTVDISSMLEVEKYEEPIPIQMVGKVRRWPSYLLHYDVENIKRPESMSAMIDGESVVATEKLHGTNISISIGPELDEGESFFVCSRNNALKEDDVNVYWRATKKYDLGSKIQKIFDSIRNSDTSNVSNVTLHGEVVGVQDLKYGYINGDIGFYAYDISVDGTFMDNWAFRKVCEQLNIPIVPEIYSGPFDFTLLKEKSTGKTLIEGASHIREGIVIKPTFERKYLGERVNFKLINPDYLVRKEGSELH